jgi:hypothetical protein
MFQVTISKTGEATRRYDLHTLRLPSGRMAHQIGGPDLYAELVKIGVPDVLQTDGWQQLALKFAQWRDDPPAAVGGVTGSKMLGVT